MGAVIARSNADANCADDIVVTGGQPRPERLGTGTPARLNAPKKLSGNGKGEGHAPAVAQIALATVPSE
jgi:hypothetical protein